MVHFQCFCCLFFECPPGCSHLFTPRRANLLKSVLLGFSNRPSDGNSEAKSRKADTQAPEITFALNPTHTHFLHFPWNPHTHTRIHTQTQTHTVSHTRLWFDSAELNSYRISGFVKSHTLVTRIANPMKVVTWDYEKLLKIYETLQRMMCVYVCQCVNVLYVYVPVCVSVCIFS